MSVIPPKSNYYFRPKDGQFQVWPTDKYGETAAVVTGVLLGVCLRQDEGTPKQKGKVAVEPYTSFEVSLKDSEKNEYYVIKSKSTINFSKFLCSALVNIEPGTPLQISVRPGTEQPKVTLVQVHAQYEDNGPWQIILSNRFEGDQDEFLEMVKNLPAYKEWTKKEETPAVEVTEG